MYLIIFNDIIVIFILLYKHLNDHFFNILTFEYPIFNILTSRELNIQYFNLTRTKC